MKLEVRIPEDRVEVRVGPEVPVAWIRAAAFVVTHRAFAALEEGEEGGVLVLLEPKVPSGREGLEALAREFREELETQALRHRIADQNADLRKRFAEVATGRRA